MKDGEIVWAIFHRGDNRWVYKRTIIEGYVNGLPLVKLEREHAAITLPEFLFDTEVRARREIDRRNKDGNIPT